MSSLLWIGFASFFYVFLRAFQQINVVTGAYLAVMATSYAMSLGDIFLVASYAREGGPTALLVLVVGSSSGTGAMCAMWARKKFFRSKL